MASQDLSGKTSRLAQMQMRFQQRQQQEKEQKRLELVGNKKDSDTDTSARSALTTAKTNNIGNGKVRQMFDERRRGAGIDRSNPLKPIATSSKSVSTPALVKKSTASNVFGVRSQEAVKTQTTKTTRKSVPNKQSYNSRSTHSLQTNEARTERNNNAFSSSSFNGIDDLDNETMPKGFYTDGDSNYNDSNNNARKESNFNGKGTQIKLNPVLTKKSPPIRKTVSTRSINSPQTPASRKSTGESLYNMKSETDTSSARTVNKTPPSKRIQQQSVEKAATPSPRTPTTPKSLAPPPEGMVACKICGRNFNDDRIAKHEEICKKMSSSKRKVYDAAKHRIMGTDVEQFQRKKPANTRATRTDRGNVPTGAAAISNQNAQPKSNWRRKHEEFIEAIRSAKQVQAHLARGGKLSDLPPPPKSENPDYIQCPHCQRRFNQAAAERHIPKCATMLHNKPKNPNLRK